MVRVCKKGSNLLTTDSKCARVWYVLHCTSYIFTARTSSQLRSYTDFHVSYSNRIIASNISFERYDDFNVNYHKWYLRYRLREIWFRICKKDFPWIHEFKTEYQFILQENVAFIECFKYYILSFIISRW